LLIFNASSTTKNMKLLKCISLFTLYFASAGAAEVATDAEGKREMTPEEMAQYDVGLGMAGLKRSTTDPVALAQLMKDLGDPEMMAEAAKMMESKEFKSQMKKLEGSKEFKESLKKTKDALSDPATQGKMEATMEHMLNVGNQKLDSMNEGIQKAVNVLDDPEILAKTAKMMAQPDFQEKLGKMMQNPGYMNAMSQMEEMMKDPAMKSKMEALGAQMAQQMAA